MAANKRTKFQIDRDRAEIARLYLQRHTQHEIAAIISGDKSRGYTLTQQMISRELGIIRKFWLQSALMNFDEAKSEELARIDELERECWNAWRKSQGKKKETMVKGVELAMGEIGRKDVSVKTWEEVGEAAFLAGVQWCINKRCEILGLDAPKKFVGETKSIIQVVSAVPRPEQLPVSSN